MQQQAIDVGTIPLHPPDSQLCSLTSDCAATEAMDKYSIEKVGFSPFLESGRCGKDKLTMRAQDIAQYIKKEVFRLQACR